MASRDVVPRRTQAERRSSSEKALLRAAAELIAERGIERASLRSIGARAGTSRETPAYHFGSKDGLITRLSDRAHERTLQATEDALRKLDRQADQLSALDALRVTIETYLSTFITTEAPEERALLVMWGATFPSDSPLPALVDADRRTHHDLSETIRAGQLDGSIRADLDADSAAVLVMGMSRGIAALSLAQPNAADSATVRTLCGEALTALLKPSSKTTSHVKSAVKTVKRTTGSRK